MKKIVVFTCALFLCLGAKLHAIEGLKITKQGGNAVLSWPSKTNETYIIQYRAVYDTNEWTTLTNSYPAALGTNWTSYVVAGVVNTNLYSSGGGGGSGGPPVPSMMMSGGDPFENEFPAFPPMPWESSEPESFGKGGLLLENQSQQSSQQSVNAWGVETMFYRVVRNGVHFVGLTNNASISGLSKFAVEVGSTSGSPLDSIAIVNAATGEPIPALSISSNGDYIFEWNTLLATNKTFQVKARAYLGTQVPYTVVESATITVTATNKIWFPDGYNIAGGYLDFYAQSVHKNGVCEVEVYGDPAHSGTNPIVTVEGLTDANGYLIFELAPNQWYQGFYLENFDEHGHLYPDSYYTFVVTTASSVGLLSVGSGNSATVTNKVPVEPNFPPFGDVGTKYSIMYQPVFGNPAHNGASAVQLEDMIKAIYSVNELRAGGAGIVRGTADVPLEMWSDADMTTWLTQDLKDPLTRNIFWFGHAGPNSIGRAGASPGGRVDIKGLDIALKNRPQTGTNAHPMRFVFIYGCESAEGNLCEAFGIPKKTGMTRQDFWNKGIRPRAFVGFKGTQNVGWLSIINYDTITFVTSFYNHWALDVYPTGHPKAGQALGLKDALYKAATGGSGSTILYDDYNDIVIYGAEDLTFSDFGDIDPAQIPQ